MNSEIECEEDSAVNVTQFQYLYYGENICEN
jgi:hypothetical protein